MNKILVTSLIASGLLLLDSPEASAHNEGHYQHRWSEHSYSRGYDRDYRVKRGSRRYYHGSNYRRASAMPRWLKRDRTFRRWYRNTDYRANRRLSWNRLYNIYRYQHRRDRYRYH